MSDRSCRVPRGRAESRADGQGFSSSDNLERHERVTLLTELSSGVGGAVVMVKATAVLLACLTAAACAAEPQSASDPNTPLSPASSSPTTERPSPSPTESATNPPPPVNQAALEKGISLLRDGGVRDVGEAEPPHGDQDANLTGVWGGHLVIVTVRRTGDPMLDWEVVERQSIADVEVQTVRGTYTFLRFPYGEFTVDLRVVDENDLRFLSDESEQLTGTILCPSECGGLPEGADG